MHRSLKELLIDDYLDFDYNNDENDDNISISLDNEQHIYYNIIHHKKTIKDYLRLIFHHPIYDYFMAFIIISSSITLGLSLETDEIYIKNSSRQKFIYAFDEILIAILFLEFIFKIYLESIYYWFNWTNIYDFSIIFFGVIEIIWNLFFYKKNSTIKNLLKGFRLLQLIRLYRIIKLFEGLQVLTKALIKTVLTYTFTVVILVFLFIYVIAVIGQMLYGKPEDR
ncbi:unnamed protein product [Rotaria sp. Silwood1]|nr:unnamed protein product [Rotaria sp. Silwood1]